MFVELALDFIAQVAKVSHILKLYKYLYFVLFDQIYQAKLHFRVKNCILNKLFYHSCIVFCQQILPLCHSAYTRMLFISLGSLLVLC